MDLINNIKADTSVASYHNALDTAQVNKEYVKDINKKRLSRKVPTHISGPKIGGRSVFQAQRSEFQEKMDKEPEHQIRIDSNLIESQGPVTIDSSQIRLYPLNLAGQDILDRSDLKIMTAKRIRQILTSRGLSQTGNKPELIERVLKHQGE